VRIHEFLVSHGALLPQEKCVINFPVNENQVLDELDQLITAIANKSKSVRNQPTIRYTHTLRKEGVLIVRREEGEFVNKWHAKRRGSQNTSANSLLLSIDPASDTTESGS